MKPKRALISVYDKTGILELAQDLAQAGVEILSTAKTARLLRDNGIKVVEVSDFTGAPEILSGRVKTLHPKIFAGILSYRAEPDIEPIDIVVVSLYPFEANIGKGLDLAQMIELIDIGGVSLLRAAAKNYAHVAVVPAQKFYDVVRQEFRQSGEISRKTREMLAAEAFAVVAHYDSVISGHLARKFGRPGPGETLSRSFVRDQELRYGENPHQKGFYYRDPLEGLEIRQLWGKELSYNNLLDIDSTLAMLGGFAEPVCTIVKHNTPCGVAVHRDQKTAFANAFQSDPTSAFGGIVGFSAQLEAGTASEIVKTFFEVIVAPQVTPAALDVLKTKKNLRVLEFTGETSRLQMRSALAGVLVQDADCEVDDAANWKTAARRKPTEQEIKDLQFAWGVTRFVRSNAIVLARNGMTLGIGAGQMSRIDSAEIAIRKAGERCAGSVMGSDGYFPFRDSIDLAARHGITAIAEPGGSIRDAEVIQAADEHNIALIFTGRRHFRH